MPREFLRYNTTRIDAIFKVDKFRHASGFRDDTKIFSTITTKRMHWRRCFNVHEEPIVNKPSECIRALLDGRIDFVVTTKGIYEKTSSN